MKAERIAAAVLLWAWSSVAVAQVHDVSQELWDRPRTAEAIAAEESVRRPVLALLAQPESRLMVHHAAGQEPLLHAEELRSWLGALAIDTRRIVLRGDLAAGAPLRIEVTP